MWKIIIKTLNAVFVSIVLILMSGNFTVAAAQNATPKLTAAEWQADVHFLAEEMPKQHPNLKINFPLISSKRRWKTGNSGQSKELFHSF